MSCLFGFVKDALCFYDLASAPVYFSLGEAVAAFGLIFALYQLTKPSWEIVLRIRPAWQRKLMIRLAALGLGFVFVASVVSQLPLTSLRTGLHPVLFEILGFLAFIMGPASYFYFATTPYRLFTKTNAMNFFQTLAKEAARANPDRIEAVVNVIYANLDEICTALKKKRIGRQPGSPPLSEDEKTAEYAAAVFDVILGESSIANYIVTARLDVLLYLLDAVKRNGLRKEQFKVGMRKMLSCLFSNPHSYLYQHLEDTGLALSANIYDEIFGNIELLEALSPLEHWNSSLAAEQAKGEKSLTVFIQAFETAANAYFSKEGTERARHALRHGFAQLNNFLTNIGRKGDLAAATERIHEVEFFLNHKYPWAFRNAFKAQRANPLETGTDPDLSFGASVNAAYAKTLYEFMEMLGHLEVKTDDDEESIRFYAMHTITHMIDAERNDEFEATRQEFLKLLWHQIQQNGDGFYPVMLRVYLLVIGMNLGGKRGIYVEERARVVEFLHKVIKPKLLAGDRMANKASIEDELLPRRAHFNRKKKRFEYKITNATQILE